MTHKEVLAQQEKERWVVTETMVRVGLHDDKLDYPSYGVLGLPMSDSLTLFTEANPRCGMYKIPYEVISNIKVLTPMEAMMMLNNFMFQRRRPTEGCVNG